MPSQETIDRNTRAVKDALKRDANRRCADCAARGPTIATIAFRTFVCQPCANAHRELFPNNKLKSVSLAEFETEEVRGLRQHGNAASREIWLARWAAADGEPAAGAPREALKRFLARKYVDKVWVAGGPPPPPPPAPAPRAVVAAPPAPSKFDSGEFSFQAPPPPAPPPAFRDRAAAAPAATGGPRDGRRKISVSFGGKKAAPEPGFATAHRGVAAAAPPRLAPRRASPRAAADARDAEIARLRAENAQLQASALPAGDPFGDAFSAPPAAAPAAAFDAFAAPPPAAQPAFALAPPPAAQPAFALAPPPAAQAAFSLAPPPAAAAPAPAPDPFAAAPPADPLAAPAADPFAVAPAGFGLGALGAALPASPPRPAPAGSWSAPTMPQVPPMSLGAPAAMPSPPPTRASPSGSWSMAAPPAAPPAPTRASPSNSWAAASPGAGPPPGAVCLAAAPNGSYEKVTVLQTQGAGILIKGRNDAQRVVPTVTTLTSAPPAQGMRVYYEMMGKCEPCTVTTVHMDAGEPYYTVTLANGTTRTTEAAHILVPAAAHVVAAAAPPPAPAAAAADPFAALTGGSSGALVGGGTTSSGKAAPFAPNDRILYKPPRGSTLPAEKATVLRVHWDAGDQPYYSIQLDSTGDERQTDAARMEKFVADYNAGAAAPPPTLDWPQAPPQAMGFASPPQQQSFPPQQPGFPQQQGYPPQQPGYPPQQQGFAPQQQGYPPQQQGFAPQQGSPQQQRFAPPQQQGFPAAPQMQMQQQQQGYPPQQQFGGGGAPTFQAAFGGQQGFPPQQQPGFQQQQPGFQQQQQGFPPQQQPGFPPQQQGFPGGF